MSWHFPSPPSLASRIGAQQPAGSSLSGLIHYEEIPITAKSQTKVLHGAGTRPTMGEDTRR